MNANKLLMAKVLVSALSIGHYDDISPIQYRKRLQKIYGRKCPVCGIEGKALWWNGREYVCSGCKEEMK